MRPNPNHQIHTNSYLNTHAISCEENRKMNDQQIIAQVLSKELAKINNREIISYTRESKPVHISNHMTSIYTYDPHDWFIETEMTTHNGDPNYQSAKIHNFQKMFRILITQEEIKAIMWPTIPNVDEENYKWYSQRGIIRRCYYTAPLAAHLSIDSLIEFIQTDFTQIRADEYPNAPGANLDCPTSTLNIQEITDTMNLNDEQDWD